MRSREGLGFRVSGLASGILAKGLVFDTAQIPSPTSDSRHTQLGFGKCSGKFLGGLPNESDVAFFDGLHV